ncbi:hypothetical protein Tco_0517120 [Tanacetum coccineum]
MVKESGAGDEDYVQKAMVHYQAETGLPFKFRHCWDVLKDSPKFQDIAFPNLNQGSQGSSKKHKSSGSNSFNTESGDASINLNNTVVNDDEVQEIRRPGGAGTKRKLLRKIKAFIELKRREVECREREIAATEYRAQQEDMKLYLQPYDHLTGEQRLAWDEIRAKIKANVISFTIISFGAINIFSRMNIDSLELGDYLAIGAIFSTIDSACTLQVFKEMCLAGFKADGTTGSSVLSAVEELGDLGVGVMIDGNGLAHEVLKCLSGYGRNASLSSETETIPCLLPACGNIAALMHGKSTHGFSLRTRILNNVYVGSALIDIYANCDYNDYRC